MTEENISIPKLNQHLNSLLKFDVDTVFNIIYNTLVKWVHKTYEDILEYQIAYDRYIELTRAAIRRIRYRRNSGKRYWFGTFLRYGAAKDEIDYLLNSLNQMPAETAITFLSELTATWCLSCPRETAKQYMDDETVSDVDLADTLFSWLLRPFDYFS